MSLNRYAARRDANENELVTAARQIGAQWEQAGPLDGWIGWRGAWVPVEIKTAKGKYTDEQILFLGRCKQHGTPVHTWRTLIDVLNSLNATQTA